jgi:uncharacterized protein YcfL
MNRWIPAILVAIFLFGCANNTTGLRIDGESQQVLFGDRVLGTRLKINDIVTTEVDGRRRGVVNFSSQYKGDQKIQYRFYWYDDQGLEVNTKLAPWRQTIVRGHEEFSISEVSINPKGTQFRVQIRQVNN